MDTSGNFAASIPTAGGIQGSNIASDTIAFSNLTTALQNQITTKIAPTIQTFTSSGIYTTPISPAPLYIKVTAVGGGGGGGAAGAYAVVYQGNNGGDTTFGSSLLTAGGGTSSLNFIVGGAGGTCTIASSATVRQLKSCTGNQGGGSVGTNIATGQASFPGGIGGASPFGGAGSGNGSPAVANSGSGGAGGGVLGSSALVAAGAGGGAGGYLEALLTAPAATYAVVIGAGGSGGVNVGSTSGGAGGSGIVIVEEFYQ